ncbi:MAG TPA: tetratricopeptide repeat protein [Polyangiaceae bacterium]|nr:tetratricopeptide repeat protein [Polyangiaceae bacterium]
MNLGKALIAASFALCTLSACTRSKQDAILRANEAEKMRKTDKEGAIAKLQEATQLDRDNHNIWHRLGELQRDKEDWKEMAAAYGEAIAAAERTSKDKKCAWASYYAARGDALLQQAKKKTISYEEAKEPYTKCVEIDPNYADCYHQLGNVYLWTDDEQKSIEFYTKAIEHNPDELRYYGPLAELYINLGYMKEAEQVLKEAKTRGKPDDKMMWGVHVLMAGVLQDRNDMAGAISELEAAKAIPTGEGPESVITLYNLGSLYAQVEPPRKQEAIEMLKGFSLRACKGQKAQQFQVECETARSLVTKLGGSLQ